MGKSSLWFLLKDQVFHTDLQRHSFNSESSVKGSSPIVDVDNKKYLDSDTTHTVHFASDVNIRHFRVGAWDSSNDSVDHTF